MPKTLDSTGFETELKNLKETKGIKICDKKTKTPRDTKVAGRTRERNKKPLLTEE